MKAHWKRRKPGERTAHEAAWEAALADNPCSVSRYVFEAVKLRLADATFYTPDFMVLRHDGSIEFHEVKGSWAAPNQDKSRVKLKVAAEMFPWFTFVAIVATKKPVKSGGGWDFVTEVIGPGKGDGNVDE